LKETTEGEKASYGLVAEQDFEENDVLYTESPLISALSPQLEVMIDKEAHSLLFGR
jgi:hypothetical protein